MRKVPKNRSSQSLILGLLFLASCSAGMLSRSNNEDSNAPSTWLHALYPTSGEGDVRVDRYGSIVTLVHDGRIYGSNGQEDVSAQIIGMAAALSLAPEGPQLLRVGQIGFGTGLSTVVALGMGSRMVDVFEQDGHIVAAGEAIASSHGLSYQEDHRPLHPALRVVPPSQAVSERFLRYDVLISPPATSAIAGPGALIVVERLENLASLLGSSGIMVQHLPLYGMQPETYRRFLRTFAQVFNYVVVVSGGRNSGDTFMLGSSSPLLFRPSHLRAIEDTQGLEELLREAHISHAFDLPARLVFSSRQEVMTFAQGAPPISIRLPLSSDAIPRPPEVPTPEASPEEISAYEEAIAVHRQNFQRMVALRDHIYSLAWPYGQLCPNGRGTPNCLLAGASTGQQWALASAELALSLMAAGRFVEAQDTLESAGERWNPELLGRARQVLALLLDDPPDFSERLPETLTQIGASINNDQCNQAMNEIETLLSTETASAEELFVAANGMVRCRPEDVDTMERVAEIIEPLIEDRAFKNRYPEALYLQAKSAMITGRYEDATWIMVDYVSRVEPPTPNQDSPQPTSSEEPELTLYPRKPTPSPRASSRAVPALVSPQIPEHRRKDRTLTRTSNTAAQPESEFRFDVLFTRIHHCNVGPLMGEFRGNPG